MNRFSYYIVGILAVTMIFWGGCDVSVNPFIFDGSPVSAVIEIDVDGTSFSETEQYDQMDLDRLLDDIDVSIDSITVFNITLQIDKLPGTPEDLLLSGSIRLDNQNLVTLSEIPVNVFANEQSIFGGAVSQYLNVNSQTFAYLMSLLGQSPLPPVTVGVSGQSSGSPVRLRVVVTLYTQVYGS